MSLSQTKPPPPPAAETPRRFRPRSADYLRALVDTMEASETLPLPHAVWEWTSADTGRLPKIQTNARSLSEASDDALAALYRVNQKAPRVFSRGTSLSRVCLDEQGRPAIGDIGPRELKRYLARTADFYKHSITQEHKDGAHVPVHTVAHPPDAIVSDILAAPSWPFPALVAVCETPVLRPDGTILIEPGYDAVTHLYYHPESGLHVPQIPDKAVSVRCGGRARAHR